MFNELHRKRSVPTRRVGQREERRKRTPPACALQGAAPPAVTINSYISSYYSY